MVNFSDPIYFIIHSDISHTKGRHSCPDFHRDKLQQESRNTLLPAGRQGIPPYQVRGRLSQARNDRLNTIYVLMYKSALSLIGFNITE